MDNIGGGDDDVRKEASAAAFGLRSCQSFLSLASSACRSIHVRWSKAVHLQLVGSINHGHAHRVFDPRGHGKSLDVDRVVQTLL